MPSLPFVKSSPSAVAGRRTWSDPVAFILAAGSVALALYLYLGRLSSSPLQTGNEAMYACPPIYMLQTGDFLVPRFEGEEFLDKPPLCEWIIAASYRVLGISVAAERLPGALGALATILVVFFFVRRRSGGRAALLAALVLAFTYSFWTFMRYSSADVLLTLFVTLAVISLDAAARDRGGSDLRHGVAAGTVLALAFLSKGLIGIVIAVGAVATGLLLDGHRPVRPARRALFTLLALLILVAPWHWAMAERLGARFWKYFYWDNQVMRGATSRFMHSPRGLFYYVPVLAAAAFPWSFLLLRSLRRRERTSSAPLGWMLFGFVFASALVMKREIYLMPIFPAAAILVGERLDAEAKGDAKRSRLAWLLAAGLLLLALVVLVRTYGFLSATIGRDSLAFLGPTLAGLLAAVTAAGLTRERVRAPLATAFACGLVFFALEKVDEGINRYDPIPEFGERVRRECPDGCDAFFVNLNAAHQEFYSRSAWIPLARPRELAGRTRHAVAYILMRTSDEPMLAELPMPSRVVDRRPWLTGSWYSAAWKPNRRAFESLSLVRVSVVSG